MNLHVGHQFHRRLHGDVVTFVMRFFPINDAGQIIIDPAKDKPRVDEKMVMAGRLHKDIAKKVRLIGIQAARTKSCT